MPIKKLLAWRDWRLATKFSILFIATIVIVLSAFTLIDNARARSQIVAEARSRNLQRARATAQLLDFYLANVDANVQMIAMTPDITEFLGSLQETSRRAKIMQVLQFARERGGYDSAFLLDPLGTVLIATDARLLGRNYTTASWFRNAAAGRTMFDEPRYDAVDAKIYLHVSAPVLTERGQVSGAAVVRLTLTPIDQIIAADLNYDGRGAFGYLVDENGIRLSHPLRQDLRFQPIAPLPPEFFNLVVFESRYGPDTAKILQSASNFSEALQRVKYLLFDNQTDPFLTLNTVAAGPAELAAAPLQNKRWVYVIGSSYTNLLAQVNEHTQSALLQAIGLGLIALAVSFIGARWITRPIRQVADTANALATGDMSRRVRLNQRDEVGKLASAFDAMADALDEKESQLREYAQTLEQRVDERTAEVSKSEEKYRALMNDASDAILIADLRGNLMDANRKAEELLGYPKAQLVGMRVEQIHPPEELPRTLAVFNQIVETGSSILRNGLVLRQDGKTVPVEISANIIEYSDGRFVQGIFHDITAQKQRERELQAIVTMATALREATTRTEMLPVILDQVMYLLDAPGANFSTLDPVTGDTLVELARGRWAQETGMRMPAGKNVSGHVIATGQLHVSNDAENDAMLYRPPWLGKISTLACVPLIAQNETIGALFVGRDSPIGDDELHILTALADMSANALQRATLYEETVRLFDEAQRNVRRLTALRAVDQAITASLDLRLILRVLLDQVVTYLHADAADVWLFNPATQSLKYAEGHGFATREMQHPTCRLGEGYAGTVALERHVVHVPNLKHAPEQSPRAAALAPEGFVTYLGAPLIAKGQLKGVLEIFHRRPLATAEEWLDFIESLALQTAIAVDNITLFNDLQRSNLELSLAADAMIESWARVLELRGRETAGHIRQVAQDTVRLARALGIGEADLVHLRHGALLHDIGKLGIPDSILFKPGALTETEQTVIRQHPVYARELLAQIEFLKPAIEIPYCHHEKWDGSGYPRGLRGEAIPLAARAFAVVDAWNTLRADRAYSPAWEEARTVDYLREQAGKQFDPKIVEVFLRMFENKP